MSRLLLVLVALMVFIGVPVARRTRRACYRSPGRVPWLIAGGVALLAGVALAVPRLDSVIPDSMRESPAGLFPVIGAVLVLSLVAVCAGAIIAGAILATRTPPA